MEPTSIQQESPEEQITDVVEFFSTITEMYIQLEQDVLRLAAHIHQSTPEQIFDECKQLKLQQEKLSIFDQQLFNILDLAGSEICHHAIIEQYRNAFSCASQSFDSLHTELQLLKQLTSEPA